MSTYVIERSVGVADVGDLSDELSAVRVVASVMTANGQPLRVLHATYVAARESFQCVIDAADQDAVHEALRQVGIHTARVLPALDL